MKICANAFKSIINGVSSLVCSVYKKHKLAKFTASSLSQLWVHLKQHVHLMRMYYFLKLFIWKYMLKLLFIVLLYPRFSLASCKINGCVCYIFSFFCMSKRKDLCNKEKCFSFHLFSFLRYIKFLIFRYSNVMTSLNA